MSLDHLWAGWRANYVASVSEGAAFPPADGAPVAAAGEGAGEVELDACVFCAIVASPATDDELRVVHRARDVIVMLNAYPYASGHLLVMPKRHVGEVAALSEGEYGELFTVTRDAMAALGKAYAPDGMNMGANFGRAAGAGIPHHLHLHVLPRWMGDTNFMTTVASTRVMPEPLSDSWRKIRQAWPV